MKYLIRNQLKLLAFFFLYYFFWGGRGQWGKGEGEWGKGEGGGGEGNGMEVESSLQNNKPPCLYK